MSISGGLQTPLEEKRKRKVTGLKKTKGEKRDNSKEGKGAQVRRGKRL